MRLPLLACVRSPLRRGTERGEPTACCDGGVSARNICTRSPVECSKRGGRCNPKPPPQCDATSASGAPPSGKSNRHGGRRPSRPSQSNEAAGGGSIAIGGGRESDRRKVPCSAACAARWSVRHARRWQARWCHPSARVLRRSPNAARTAAARMRPNARARAAPWARSAARRSSRIRAPAAAPRASACDSEETTRCSSAMTRNLLSSAARPALAASASSPGPSTMQRHTMRPRRRAATRRDLLVAALSHKRKPARSDSGAGSRRFSRGRRPNGARASLHRCRPSRRVARPRRLRAARQVSCRRRRWEALARQLCKPMARSAFILWRRAISRAAQWRADAHLRQPLRAR
eukprot:scaffold13277_cov114-Isochrysis_galbana.AAC.4